MITSLRIINTVHPINDGVIFLDVDEEMTSKCCNGVYNVFSITITYLNAY